MDSQTRAPNELTAQQAAEAIAAGRLSSEALVAACLARIAAREPALQAWAHVDPARALEAARARDRELKAGRRRGALHGVPIGVKDVLDTADMPTAMGSPIYAGWQPKSDAACVALARTAGAVILGKTVTCELAGPAASPTRHPMDATRTPGGSSSGSAVAVADRHVPVALGTQTGGSVLRPASYCGLVGYKPTYNAINRAGMKFAAESLDTIGVIARDVSDAALLAEICMGLAPAPVAKPAARLRIGLCRNVMWESSASPETRVALEAAAARARGVGAAVEELVLGATFAELEARRGVINDRERACALACEWADHRDRLSPQMREIVARGLAAPLAEYNAVLQLADQCRRELERMLRDLDVLITPAANGEAPAGLASTGDPAFQSLWTMLHVPTITLPLASGPNGLPVGVQLVAARWQDRRLLSAAQWLMDAHRL